MITVIRTAAPRHRRRAATGVICKRNNNASCVSKHVLSDIEYRLKDQTQAEEEFIGVQKAISTVSVYTH